MNRGGLLYYTSLMSAPNGSQIVTSPDGYRWCVGGNDTDDHLALGGHETALEPIMVSMCDPERAFLNVGAHVGLWAIRMAKHAKRVYAIEANANTAHALQRNVVLNDLDDEVIIYTMALWDNDTDKVLMVDANGKTTGGSTRAELRDVDKYEKDEKGSYVSNKLISTRRLDGFQFSPIGLIVMDVEGAEARVLRGAKETIARDRPNMIIELHEGHPGTDADLRQQVYDVLDELNYTYVSVDITGERLLCYPDPLDEFPAE